MSRSKDPYFDVRAEVESSLSSAASLHSSYKRILLTLPVESHAHSDELLTTRSELKSTLSTLFSLVSELDHVVRFLEADLHQASSSSSSPPRQLKFGISSQEIRSRRAWISNVQVQLEDMNKTIEGPIPSNPTSSSYHPLIPSPPMSPTHKINSGASTGRSRFDRPQSTESKTKKDRAYFQEQEPGRDIENGTEDFYQEQETMILKQQDQTLGTISNVVGVLREQASLMGQEISEQNVILDDLSHQVDHTESKLAKANRKLNKFVEENKHSKSSWSILILIIILILLLLAIVIV